MGDKPHDELMASLCRAYEEGTYSDLTIIAGQDEYKVHKVLVCGRSDFFKGACTPSFKEGNSSVINLPEDDPQAVKLMLHYLYYLDYPHQAEVKHGFLQGSQDTGFTFTVNPTVNLPSKGKTKKQPHTGLFVVADAPEHPNLVVHARLYALGEKYGIPGLKALSLEKFKYEAEKFWDTDDFIRAIEEVYATTIDRDRGLRDVVENVIVKHADFLDNKRAQSVVRDLDLCFDLMMRFRK